MRHAIDVVREAVDQDQSPRQFYLAGSGLGLCISS